MQGNHLMTPQGRLLFAAAVFAILAIVALLFIWKWPSFFGSDEIEPAPLREYTAEEKADIYEQLQATLVEPGVTPTEEEKVEIYEQLAPSDTAGEEDVSEQEKLEMLNSLNTP